MAAETTHRDAPGVSFKGTTDLFRVDAEVPRLQKVSDSLYRSAEPTPEGLRYMERMGIRTVIRLCAVQAYAEGIKQTCLPHKRIRIKKLYPKKRQVVKFLRLVTNEKRTPVLVHCEHGIHRTGLMCMAYRMVVQGWSKEKAMEELLESDFGMHRYWGVIEWMRSVDMNKIKERRAKREKVKSRLGVCFASWTSKAEPLPASNSIWCSEENIPPPAWSNRFYSGLE